MALLFKLPPHQQAKTTEHYLLFNNLFRGNARHNLDSFITRATMLACTSRRIPTHRGMSDDVSMTNVIYFNLQVKITRAEANLIKWYHANNERSSASKMRFSTRTRLSQPASRPS